MIRYDIYIAGSMHGRLGKEVLEERAAAKLICRLQKVTYYDPAEDEDINPKTIIDLKPNLRRMKWFVSKDDYHVDRCRTLLVLTGDKSSSGTGWEMARMFYKNKRSVFLVAPKMYNKQLTNFSTVKATKIFETVEQAVKYIANRRKERC